MAENLWAPHDVFRKHYAGLQHAIISPLELAGLLYSDGLINEGTKNEVNSSNAPPCAKAACLLDAVERTLGASSQPESVLSRLCNVLERSGEPSLEQIALRMKYPAGERLKR